MKICVCTTPIRLSPTEYPPFGSLAIIQSLRQMGKHVDFYHIDYFRYTWEQIEEYFSTHHYDVVGISAVVSTAYAYTKNLSGLIRKVSPETTIVLGGNMATCAEIILRKTEVDFCVVGDGEIIIRNLIRVLSEKPLDYNALRSTLGICFLDEKEKFNFTGFGDKPSAKEIEMPDYSILEDIGVISQYIYEPNANDFYGHSVEVKPGEKATIVVMNKGCVAHCTFCHRWEKGYRSLPAERVIRQIMYLKTKHNVRFILVGDENFGSDRKATWDLVSMLGSLGIVWRVGGVRTNTVSRESLLHWKNNGCVSVIYGVESGSPSMLKVMEKNTSLEDNINAITWTGEVGLETTIQLVIGMPGESDSTINESINFLKQIFPYMLVWRNRPPSECISINLVQALPGTPLYEFARERDIIGKTLDDEESYLLKISDINAGHTSHYLNYTNQSLLKALTWRSRINSEIDAHWLKQRGIYHISVWGIFIFYFKRLKARFSKTKPEHDVLYGAQNKPLDSIKDSGYFNISQNINFAPILLNPMTRPFFGYFLLLGAVAREFVSTKSLTYTLKLIGKHIQWKARNILHPATNVDVPIQSLRKLISITSQKDNDGDKMIPLRKGR